MCEINMIKLIWLCISSLSIWVPHKSDLGNPFADVVLEIAACWSELERLGTMAIALVVIGTPK